MIHCQQRIITIVFISTIFIFNSVSAQDEQPNYLNNPNYDIQTDLYEIYKTRQADIIMLGNSLTHGVEWYQLLGRTDVVAQGITSDVTEGILNRMSYVFRLQPKICFVMAGLNDIYNWTPVEDIYTNYVRIINLLRLKNVEPVIQSVTYAGRNWGKQWDLTPEINAGRNAEVDKLNTLLREYAAKNNIEFIELNDRLSSDNFLRPEFTIDGVHLNARAYKIWVGEVEKVLLKKGF